MHNPPPSSPLPSAFNMDSIDDSTSIWDWSQFLDFNIDDHLPLPTERSDHSPANPTSQELYPIDNPNPNTNDNSFPDNSKPNITNDRVRKRDPRMACSNFLAGRIPCACPELDALLAAEEEEAAPGKKKTRTARTVVSSRCQVPGCEVDISELKGYHKRHRVCLRCATASSVELDGHNKRYCQQCGKFHVLSDFDEGKRSCRRKLERHNNRRRRKPSDSKGSEIQSLDDDDGYDDAKKGDKPTTSELSRETPFLAAEGKNTISSSVHAQNIHSDSVPSLVVSGETQTDEEKEKITHSPSYCDDKSAFSSMCPTGRISFKLYDWNPAEFPRRLRHQIFQWLADMPVELEGYIRPGCTIFTIFIAMPRFMWVKLSEDPIVRIHDLLASPRSLLSGRDTFFINLNNIIFSVVKGGRSVIRTKVGDKSPKLHYVQPTCFEAGKPIDFVACGSNLLQPSLRFLVSFAGKYMTNDLCVSPLTNSDHQFLNIRVPRTEFNVFGPGFIEVENESGVSNFIPILVAEEEICSEIKIIQKKYYSIIRSQNSDSSTSTTNSCEIAVNKFSELLVDMAWLLKQPITEDTECDMMTSSHLQRFDFLINFLIEYKSTIVLKRVLNSMKMRISKSDGCDGDRWRLHRTVDHATEVLNRRLEKKVKIGFNLISTVDQDMLEKTALLNAECVMTVPTYNKQTVKPSNRVFNYYYNNNNNNKLFKPRPLILTITFVTICFGICAMVFHPRKTNEIAVTIRTCLFNDN